jgi:hypothetical protein
MTAIVETPSPALAPHWERARASYARAIAQLGGPAAIAAIARLSRALRLEIVRWLCPLEHIARKLLLAEAGRLLRDERARAAHGPRLVRIPLRGIARHATSRNAQTVFSPVYGGGKGAPPETWNARFSFAPPRDPLAVPEARAPRMRALWGSSAPAAPPPPRTPRTLDEAEAPFRLARRFEAVRRVLADPLPYAQRLVRLLVRLLPRYPEAVRNFAFSPARASGYDPADPRLSIDATGLALNFVFADTS